MAVRRDADVAAFSAFVDARSGSLLRTGYLVIGDYQLAQDLVQESLVKTYVAWPRIRDLASAEAYTRRVMVTTAISWRRRRSFHEQPAEVWPDGDAGDLTDPLESQVDLWDELRLVPPRQRAAVVLRFCEDLSEAQTADLMGCSVGTVKKHVSLGLAKLRHQLGPRFTPPTPPPSEQSAVIS
jgi:RNA polymerase sigma-70 factor (sigma-E family)